MFFPELFRKLKEFAMNRFTLPATLLAVVFASSYVTPTRAHDGHDNSRKPDREIKPRSVPLDSRPTEVGPEAPKSFRPDFRGGFGELPERSRPIDAKPQTHRKQNVRPRDLRTLAIRLEFATEIVSDEICFDMRHSRSVATLLSAAGEVEKQAQHFRSSIDEKADADHLRKDFQLVTGSFVRLVRLLRQRHGSFLVDRVMSRADLHLAHIQHQLGNQPLRPNVEPPLPPQTSPNDSATPLRLVIPKEAKGIALLPPADRAGALAQRTCPVTGDLLGADGKPLKVKVRGRTVFVCCEGCVDELKANPDEFLPALR